MPMKLSVHVKPGSRKESIEKISESEWVVKIKDPPVEGRANAGLIRMLSEHLNVPKSRITILKGQTSRKKIVEIDV